MNDSSCVFEIIYNTMQQSHNTMSVKTLCEMAGVSRSGYYAWAKALKTSNVADNLLQREFEAYGPRIVLLTDITYLPYNGTFAYLSTILDAFTKQILSYVLSPSLEVDFVLETINELVENHGVSLQAETIIHSDQGATIPATSS